MLILGDAPCEVTAAFFTNWLRVVRTPCAVFVFVMSCGPTSLVTAQSDWTVHETLPDGINGATGAFPLPTSTGYCLFYNSAGGIAFATSNDLESGWTPAGLVGGLPGSTYAPSVLRDPDTEGLRMYYSQNIGATLLTGLALSSGDCGIWDATGVVLSPSLQFEGTRSDYPTVVFDGSWYHLWYWAGNPGTIGYARSDDGETWVKYPDSVVLPSAGFSAVDEPNVLLDPKSGVFEMWFTKSRADLDWVATGRATSLDGVHWVERPVLDFDDPTVAQEGAARVLFDETSSTYHMWYSADVGGAWRVRHATSQWALPRASFSIHPMPEWTVGGDTGQFDAVGTAPLRVSFDASQSTSPNATALEFTWTLSDGAESSGPTAEVLHELPGVYRVLLKATDPQTGEFGIVERSYEVAESVGFVRGDCNDDGAVDLSDAVATLGSLFLGVGDPACDDACDSNDDGMVDTSDPITTLGALFLGAPQIPAPGIDECGVDPTEDELTCDTTANCTE